MDFGAPRRHICMTQSIPPESNDQFLSTVRAAAGEFAVNVSPEELNAASRDLYERVNARVAVGKPERKYPGSRVPKWLAYAAAGIVLCGVAIQEWSILSVRNEAKNNPTVQSAFTEYRTRAGQRADVILKDGTHVLLNVASSIQVPNNFNTDTREIILDGEAQFTVTHNPRRPFVVRANGTVVRDLATVFTVRAYSATGEMKVSVRDGRVAVQSPAVTAINAVTVNAMQMATIARDAVPVITHISSHDDVFAWTEGELVLKATPLGEAVTELSRWYDLDFRVADSSLLKLTITARMPATFNPNYLRHVTDVVGARAKREGRVVTLYVSPNSSAR